MKSFVVALTCVGGRLIYDIIAALRAAEDFNVIIIGIDADPNAPGRLLCDYFYCLPMAVESEGGYIDAILDIHQKMVIDVFIALSEDESLVVAKHKQRLSAVGIEVSTSDYDVVKCITHKLAFNRFLRENRIDNGYFSSLDSVTDLREVSRSFGYPQNRFVIKPAESRGSRGVFIVDSAVHEFKRLLPHRLCGTGSLEVFLSLVNAKEWIEGELILLPYYGGDVYDVDCIVDRGELVEVVTRLRQLKNPLSPSSTGHKVLREPKVIAFVRELCKVFGLHGAGDFDIVMDGQGKPILLDAGARFSGSVGASFVAGINVPAQLIRLLKHLPLRSYALDRPTILRPFITMAVIPDANEMDYM